MSYNYFMYLMLNNINGCFFVTVIVTVILLNVWFTFFFMFSVLAYLERSSSIAELKATLNFADE